MASTDWASQASIGSEQTSEQSGRHIMAILPPNASTRLGDFRPIIRASEGERDF
jgi:hypothetical protein